MKIKDYFNIRELVDKDVYNRYGDKGWKFFCPLLLENLLILREGLNIPLVINNWYNGGKFSQRGLRHNRSEMVKNKSGIYLSPHMMGKAVDFHSPNMSSTDIRRWIKENENHYNRDKTKSAASMAIDTFKAFFKSTSRNFNQSV